MKSSVGIIGLMLVLASCVPAKKYNELVEREKKCSEELERYKNSALDNEGKAKDLQARFDILNKEVGSLKVDTNDLGTKYRLLQTEYDKTSMQLEAMENAFDKMRLSGAKETATLQLELEAKNIELQRKEDALTALESELKTKAQLLAEREQNGKIYVSMEAKLLFASGSTLVEANGKKALIELAKVLENEKELEIIVEGHTDTDKLASAAHPKNNWELSVLRSTSVIDIMLTNSKMNPAQLMAGGRSEYQPIDPANKAKNRRIEVIISPNLNELYDIISK